MDYDHRTLCHAANIPAPTCFNSLILNADGRLAQTHLADVLTMCLALNWRVAADQADPAAQFHYGLCLEKGEGISKRVEGSSISFQTCC
jgi:TPR repeat protein